MAGMPAMFTAAPGVSGAQVITVTVSPEPPGRPGTTPQPVVSSAPAATVLVRSLQGRGVMRRRHPVMGMNFSASRVTPQCAVFNAR